jgi:peptide/nickel transport system substrate-binding protein
LLLVGLVGIAAAGCGEDGTTTTSAAGPATTGPATTGGGTDTTAAPPTTAAGEPVMGGILKVGTVSHPAKFGFPPTVFGPDQWFEGLFLEMMFNPTDQIDVYTPALAESWELTPDKSAYIFKLRQGVKFHDGTDFNAEACKFCWELAMGSPPPAPPGPPPGEGGPPPAGTDSTAGGPPPAGTDTTAGGPPPGAPAGPPPDFAFVDSIEVVDTYTVKVNLKYWSNQILPFIGRKSWAVFSPTAYQKNGAEWMNTNPVGTGAFMLKSFTPDQKMVLEKFPNYWGKDAQGRQLPYLDGVEIQVFGDPSTMTMALQAGQIDGTDQVSLVGAQQLQSDPRFILDPFGGPVTMMEMNTTDPASVWSDIRMRQALEYAIDKEGIAKSVGLGFTPAVYEVIHSVRDVVDPGTTPRTYDPEKAKSLMADAGHPTVEFTLSYDTNRTEPNLPEAIQANLAAVGITVKLNGMNTGAFAAISTKVPQGNDMIFQGLRGGSPNVLQGAIEMYGKGTIYFPAANFPPEFYTLMDQAQSHPSIADANPDIAQMEKIAYEDAQVCPITMAAFISVTGPKLKNMEWHLGNTPTPWFVEAWLVQ